MCFSFQGVAATTVCTCRADSVHVHHVGAAACRRRRMGSTKTALFYQPPRSDPCQSICVQGDCGHAEARAHRRLIQFYLAEPSPPPRLGVVLPVRLTDLDSPSSSRGGRVLLCMAAPAPTMHRPSCSEPPGFPIMWVDRARTPEHGATTHYFTTEQGFLVLNGGLCLIAFAPRVTADARVSRWIFGSAMGHNRPSFFDRDRRIRARRGHRRRTGRAKRDCDCDIILI